MYNGLSENKNGYSPSTLSAQLVDRPHNREVKVQELHSPAVDAPPQRASVLNNICTKKANLRATLLNEFSLENADTKERIADLKKILSDINKVSRPGNDIAENQGIIYRLFKEPRFATLLAESPPKEVLNNNQAVVDYYVQYLPDIIYKAVYGQYPEGRGKRVHGQNSDERIAPLTIEDLQGVYRELGISQDTPLINIDKLQSLKHFLPVESHLQRIHGATMRDTAIGLRCGAMGMYVAAMFGLVIHPIVTGAEIVHSDISRYVTAQALVGSAVMGMGYGVLALPVPLYIGNLIKNTVNQICNQNEGGRNFVIQNIDRESAVSAKPVILSEFRQFLAKQEVASEQKLPSSPTSRNSSFEAKNGEWIMEIKEPASSYIRTPR